jgi:hypothetical protein
MTALTDVKAITPTPNAKLVISAGGADVSGLMSLIQQHIIELRALVSQVIKLHPNGDANLTALNALLAELA